MVNYYRRLWARHTFEADFLLKVTTDTLCNCELCSTWVGIVIQSKTHTHIHISETPDTHNTRLQSLVVAKSRDKAAIISSNNDNTAIIIIISCLCLNSHDKETVAELKKANNALRAQTHTHTWKIRLKKRQNLTSCKHNVFSGLFSLTYGKYT